MIRVATRGSALARAQTELVLADLRRRFPDERFEAVEIRSDGDLSSALEPPDQPGQGWFTSQLERALLRGEVDVAVHSAKDLPTEEPPELVICAFLPRADPRDSLFADGVRGWQDLPRQARVGTTSPRRAAQLRALRPDLVVVPLRGNVDTRLLRVRERAVDACVVAKAGLDRLGAGEGAIPLDPVSECTPAPAQGAIAVQVTVSSPLRPLIAELDDPSTRTCVEAERSLLRALGGGCRMALGVLARPAGDGLIQLSAAFAGGSRPDIVRRRNRLARAEDLGEAAQALAREFSH